MPTDDTTYAEALLRETRDELAKADAKASILLAASGIALAALLSNGSDSSWYPDNLNHGAARIATWVALGLTLAGIGIVGAAVKPRLRAKHERRPDAIHYFGDVESFRPGWWKLRSRRETVENARAQFAARIAAPQAQDYGERLSDQIWTLSHIAYRKYRLISFGMWLYALALLAATVAFVVEREWL